jgi:hypothetical protein
MKSFKIEKKFRPLPSFDCELEEFCLDRMNVFESFFVKSEKAEKLRGIRASGKHFVFQKEAGGFRCWRVE